MKRQRRQRILGLKNVTVIVGTDDSRAPGIGAMRTMSGMSKVPRAGSGSERGASDVGAAAYTTIVPLSPLPNVARCVPQEAMLTVP